MKKMILLLIVVSVVLVGIFVVFWAKHNLTHTPIDKSPAINKICNGFLPTDNSGYSNIKIIQYQNDSGFIGGYRDGEFIDGEEFWGTLYDMHGDRVDLGIAFETASASARNELTLKARAWIANLEREYPVKKEFNCSR